MKLVLWVETSTYKNARNTHRTNLSRFETKSAIFIQFRWTLDLFTFSHFDHYETRWSERFWNKREREKKFRIQSPSQYMLIHRITGTNCEPARTTHQTEPSIEAKKRWKKIQWVFNYKLLRCILLVLVILVRWVGPNTIIRTIWSSTFFLLRSPPPSSSLHCVRLVREFNYHRILQFFLLFFSFAASPHCLRRWNGPSKN